MGHINLNDFFKEFTIEQRATHYETVRHYFKALDAVSRISVQGLYVIDYFRKGFIYVSDHSLFLCGYTAREVLKMGYSFYEKVVPPEDLEMLLEINHMGFDLFYRTPAEVRKDVTISYDFRITHKNRLTTMINHKLTPVQFSSDGDIWLALCMVNPSFREKSGNVLISMNGLVQRYSYSFDSRKWKKTETISLTPREKDILQLAIQGCSNEDIARQIFVEVDTIKFHKKNIFRKLDVKNISEAINFIHNNNLMIE